MSTVFIQKPQKEKNVPRTPVFPCHAQKIYHLSFFYISQNHLSVFMDPVRTFLSSTDTLTFFKAEI